MSHYKSKTPPVQLVGHISSMLSPCSLTLFGSIVTEIFMSYPVVSILNLDYILFLMISFIYNSLCGSSLCLDLLQRLSVYTYIGHISTSG